MTVFGCIIKKWTHIFLVVVFFGFVILCNSVKSSILDLALTHHWFSDRQKLFATSQIMKGKSLLWPVFRVDVFTILIICWCCRTLDVAKTVIMDKSYVYNKADEVIDLSKDGKLEDVSSFSSHFESSFVFSAFWHCHKGFTLLFQISRSSFLTDIVNEIIHFFIPIHMFCYCLIANCIP